MFLTLLFSSSIFPAIEYSLMLLKRTKSGGNISKGNEKAKVWKYRKLPRLCKFSTKFLKIRGTFP